jgi:FKBP-type peptidyl-prolyl cis-trans isomerase
MKLRRFLALAGVGMVCVFLCGGCGEDDEADAKELNVYTMDKGQVVMRYLDLVEGKGEPIKKDDEIEVHYTGWLTSGKKFDSSLDRGKPFALKIGAGQVIKGWDEGIVGMKIGGKRKLFIPPALGYGDQPMGKSIPAKSKLIFEVEALKKLEPGTVEQIRQMEMMQMQMQQRGRGF